jgi:phosphatidylethanolamine/phosphatidyl-N-methylethanolamine N-methyltransferase
VTSTTTPSPKKNKLRPVMRERSTKKIYDVQAKVYDRTFGVLVKKRIGKAIGQLDIREGDLVLDLGVGTGNSLQFYPDRGTVVGIDLSNGMLEKAQRKIEEKGWTRFRMVQADALKLPFADNSFDHIFVSHVISVVSDPAAVIREMQRVGKPGARMVMLNHFQSTNRVIAKVEKLLSPICTKLGWRSDLALNDLLHATGIHVDFRYKLTTPDIWETVVFTNKK